MRAIFAVAMLVIAATSLIMGQAQAKKPGGPSDSTAEAVRQLHSEIVQAQLASDTATLDRLWADDHIFTNPLGVVQTKAQRLAEMQSGGRRLETFSIADIQVRAYGDTAVVTSRATLKGQRQGQDISGQYRGIDVYVKKQGQWQVVAAQATRIAQP
jgi:ketosteroid isomerase-like protein